MLGSEITPGHNELGTWSFMYNLKVTLLWFNQMWLLLITVILFPMKGITKQHFKKIRTKFDLQGMVQIHHIIPRQFRNHPVLKGFDMESGLNLIFMPTELGKQHLNTMRPTHSGGHSQYNKFVGRQIENIYRNHPMDSREEEVLSLVRSLKKNLTTYSDIPWA